MHLTKTSMRAVLVSVAIVAIGLRLAAGAVFQSSAASARTHAGAPVAAAPTTPTTKVRPRVIVRTRYVTDVVHRPAPTTTTTPRVLEVSAPVTVAPAPVAVPPSTTAPTAAAVVTTTAPAPATTAGEPSDDDTSPATGDDN